MACEDCEEIQKERDGLDDRIADLQTKIERLEGDLAECKQAMPEARGTLEDLAAAINSVRTDLE